MRYTKQIVSFLVVLWLLIPSVSAESEPREIKEEYKPAIISNDLEFKAKRDGATIYMEWDSYEKDDFEYYKIMRSTTHSNPVYPDQPAIKFLDNADIDELKIQNWNKESAVYRICVISQEKDRYCSNTVKLEGYQHNKEEYKKEYTDKKEYNKKEYKEKSDDYKKNDNLFSNFNSFPKWDSNRILAIKNSTWRVIINFLRKNSHHVTSNEQQEMVNLIIEENISVNIYSMFMIHKKILTEKQKLELLNNLDYKWSNKILKSDFISLTSEETSILEKRKQDYKNVSTSDKKKVFKSNLEKRANALVEKFVKRIEDKYDDNENRIAIIKKVMERLNAVAEKKPNLKEFVTAINSALEERIEKYDNGYEEIEDILNDL